MLEATISKDGNGILVCVWDIDKTKPKMSISTDGFYDFNKHLKQRIIFSSVESFIDKISKK